MNVDTKASPLRQASASGACCQTVACHRAATPDTSPLGEALFWLILDKETNNFMTKRVNQWIASLFLHNFPISFENKFSLTTKISRFIAWSGILNRV